MGACVLCRGEVERRVDLGAQPVASRFVTDAAADEYTHPMVLGQCARCALLQLADPMPPAEVVPRYEWIVYNEPEAHLDDMVDRILALPGVTRDSVIAGVSCKDDSTLDRVRARGYDRVWRLDLRDDLGVDAPAAGMESVTTALTPERAEAIVASRGAVDVLLVRHALEHAYDVAGFVSAAAGLLAPGGHLVVEIPDASRDLDSLDYASIWEEHTVYFTPATFSSVFPLTGLETEWERTYEYPFEDSLVAAARVSGRSVSAQPADVAEFERGRVFAEGYPAARESWRAAIAPHATRGKVALFGAGHVAVSFLGLLGLADLVSFVLDDSEHKSGMLMPGSHIPIVGSDRLDEGDVSLCLMCLSPTAEEKVLAAKSAYIAAGGIMASIIPTSAHALSLEAGE